MGDYRRDTVTEEHVDVAEGKYTVILRSNGSSDALRYGEPWPAYAHGSINNLEAALARDLIAARAELTRRDANETRNCLNWGPCSRHDGRMVTKDVAAKATAERLVSLVDTLRADEGDSVMLLCDNPEGPPNNAVICNGGWTDYCDRRFDGETLIAALQAAVDAQATAEDV